MKVTYIHLFFSVSLLMFLFSCNENLNETDESVKVLLLNNDTIRYRISPKELFDGQMSITNADRSLFLLWKNGVLLKEELMIYGKKTLIYSETKIDEFGEPSFHYTCANKSIGNPYSSEVLEFIAKNTKVEAVIKSINDTSIISIKNNIPNLCLYRINARNIFEIDSQQSIKFDFIGVDSVRLGIYFPGRKSFVYSAFPITDMDDKTIEEQRQTIKGFDYEKYQGKRVKEFLSSMTIAGYRVDSCKVNGVNFDKKIFWGIMIKSSDRNGSTTIVFKKPLAVNFSLKPCDDEIVLNEEIARFIIVNKYDDLIIMPDKQILPVSDLFTKRPGKCVFRKKGFQ
jgi:hypothetical protein